MHFSTQQTFIAITNENGTIIIRMGSKIRQKLPIHSSHRDVRIVLHFPELRPALCVFRCRVRNVHSERLRQQSELIAYESDLCRTSTDPSKMLDPLHLVVSIIDKPLIEKRKVRRSSHQQIRLLKDVIEAAFEHKAHRRREAVPSIHHIILRNIVSIPNTCVNVSGRKVVHSSLSIHAASCSFVCGNTLIAFSTQSWKLEQSSMTEDLRENAGRIIARCSFRRMGAGSVTIS